MIQLTLPYPPSVNSYWRHPTTGRLAGRHLISEKGRAYRQEVLACVLQANSVTRFSGRLSIHFTAHPPDRRRRDLDNLLKALNDSLVFCKVIEDDGLIDKLIIERGTVSAPGYVFVTIEEM